MPARRIVSLVPSLTELLAALGLDDEVVGLTRFCVHPEGWKARKRIVGGTKNVALEKVEPLAPDLVIASKEENMREQVEAIEAFAPVHLTDIATVEGALAEIRTIGGLVGREAAADALATDLARGFDALPPLAEPIRALYLIWRDPWMAAGGDTFISDVLARGGVENVLADRDRYPTLTPDAIADLAPDVVLLSSEPYPFADKHLAEVRPLAPEAEVRLVDGEAFSWYGPRMGLAPDALRDLRTPEASRPRLTARGAEQA
ncbi:MAG: helical backbone metal receptor [Bacteroidota bacterium]